MYERMQYLILSSWTKHPTESAVLIKADEDDAIKTAERLNKNSEESDILGTVTYRVAHVRVTELDDEYLDHPALS